MDWKALDSVIQDHYSTLSDEQVESLSKELLEALNDKGTQPLQALKVSYVLALLQLKKSQADKVKALQFANYFETIFQHEIQTTEQHPSDRAPAHLLYVRKLAEHYLHHLMMVSEWSQAKNVTKKLHALRMKNHGALLSLQQTDASLWKKEERRIQNFFRRHYLFFGLLLTFALYFTWTSFWELSDTLMMQWVYSEYSVDSVGFLIRNSLLLFFSAGTVWAFVRYQNATEED